MDFCEDGGSTNVSISGFSTTGGAVVVFCFETNGSSKGGDSA